MPELWMPTNPDFSLQTQLIDAGLKPDVNRPFANGELANNHLNLGFEEVPPRLITPVVGVAVTLLMAHNVAADFVASVPTGADGWGKELVSQLPSNPRHLTFQKAIKGGKAQRRKFVTPSNTIEDIKQMVEELGNPRGIVVDDATSDGGTTEAFADHLQSLGLTPSVLLSLFWRGETMVRSKYNRAVVFRRVIPYMLDWSLYNATGVITPEPATRKK